MYTSQLYVISCRVSIHFLQNFNTFFIIVVGFIYIFSVFYVFLLQICQFHCNLLLCFCHNLFREFHEFQQLDCIARCHSSRIQPVIKINIILSDPLCKMIVFISTFQQYCQLIIMGRNHHKTILSLHIIQNRFECRNSLFRVGSFQDLINNADRQLLF